MSVEMRSQQIEMLIRFFNMQAGASFRVGRKENREAVSGAIDRANGDIVAIKNFVREWASAHKDDEVSVIDCFDAFKKEEPAPAHVVEEVQAHPDFRVIAAGNTFGLGANYEYVGRNQLDMASLDRFAVVRVGYDRNIELNVAQGNTELVDFAEDARNAVRKDEKRNSFGNSYRLQICCTCYGKCIGNGCRK